MADVDCHSFYQTFWPNPGPSSVVDQGTGHGDLYTQIRAAGKQAWAMMYAIYQLCTLVLQIHS